MLRSPKGREAASNQIVELNQNSMFLGHNQVLFFASHPNSQLLLRNYKPGNAHLFGVFDKPIGP